MELVRFFLDYWGRIEAQLARRQKYFFGAIVALNIVAGVMNTLLLRFVNDALNLQAFSMALFIGFTALVLLMPLTRYISQLMMRHSILHLLENLHTDYCRRMLQISLRDLEQKGISRFTASLGDDLDAITGALLAIINVVMHSALFISCLAYLCWLSPKAFAITFGVMVGLMVLYSLIALKGQAYLAVARGHYADLFDHFQALMDGNKELKLHRERRSAFFNQMFRPSTLSFQRFIFFGNTTYNAARALGTVIYFLLVGVMVFYLGPSMSLSQEVLSGYVLGLLFMVGPLESVVGSMVVMDRAKVAVRKVVALGVSLGDRSTDRLLPKPDDEPVPQQLPPWQKLTLSNVIYRYEEADAQSGSHFQLGPLNLSFQPGEVLIIAGGNGSGKTTLGKVITGLYEPSEGQLLYNDIPITDDNRDDFRQLFSAVFVDTFLFETFAGLPSDGLDERAKEVLEKLRLQDKVTVIDGRLSTLDLSQGQRKRLALLTAYLEDRPFYVFDEWTANQDPEFRDVFYTDILADLRAKGKAVVVITHDDQYFDVADRFIKLDFGRVVEDVTHHTSVGNGPQ